MDFDPHSIKWKCCCCSLPTGMQFLASFELVFCTTTGLITMYNIANQKPAEITAFEICLVSLMLFSSLTSILLLIGIHKHASNLLYPSLLSRGLSTLFLAVFGVSTVFAHSGDRRRKIVYTTTTMRPGVRNQHSLDDSNMGLHLVLFVFGMLFLTIIIFYTSYLVVRLIHYEQSYARLKERRSSLIHAAMIGEDFPSPNSSSRRASST